MKTRILALLLAAGFSLLAIPQLTAEPVTLPAGTVLYLRNDIPISTEFSQRGYPVRATVVQPFLYASEEVIPIGSTLTGKLRYVKRPGRFRGRGELHLVFEQLELATGETYSLQAVLYAIDNPDSGLEVVHEGTLRNSPQRKKETVILGVGAGTSAVIGSIVGGPAGAAIGAGIGGGVMLARRGRHAYLDAGAEFRVELITPLQIAGR